MDYHGRTGALDSRANRAMLASLTFESKGDEELSAANEPLAEVDKAPSASGPAKKAGDEPNDATKMVIRCMKLALSKTIAGISMPEKFRPLNPQQDFDIRTRLVFGGAGKAGGCCSGSAVRGVSRSEGDEDGEDREPIDEFIFTDYSPMCYRHIRSFFNVDATQYRDVLCRSGWHSIPTPGKSAAQLFFCGQNWVIKTMTKEESIFLRSILHRYYYHVRDNPHTLLPHFVGHHSIRFTATDEKITFVIMQNVFATPNKIHEKYDLKGSTVGRYATKAEKLKQTCTKKDLDINRPLVVGDVRRRLVIDQMRRDCDFLRKAGIMDYSFLVGIHHVASAGAGGQSSEAVPGASPERRSNDNSGGGSGVSGAAASAVEDGRCFTSDQGGMMRFDDGSGAPREIYYVGIIDILQEYNWWKFSETCVRSITNDRHQISSVDPREYAARFVSFMSSLLV